MEAIIEVSNDSREHTNIAEVKISVPDLNQSALLDIDLNSLYNRCGLPNNYVLDFLFISSVIYVIDRIIPRKAFSDNWTRDIKVCIPVLELNDFLSLSNKFSELATYLTGDDWEISFEKLNNSVLRLDGGQQNLDQEFKLADKIDKVSLFSGGLDSLIGAINLLENNSDSIQLIGHYDGNIKGVNKAQLNLYDQLKSKFPNRLDLQQTRIGFVKNSISNTKVNLELSTRSRSLLFISLGIYAAESVGSNTNLIMPENGFISLNIPYSPSRRGSCSTRTTHPYVLSKINEIFQDLGINQKVKNPYLFSTKGEMVKNVNGNTLSSLYKYSVSCSKTGHTKDWIRKNASQCGVCVPCIIRRAALYSASLDDETYGSDFCTNEIVLDDKLKFYQDLRDILYFLDQNYSDEKIAALISNNGQVLIDNLDRYKSMIKTGLSELDDIFRNKANRL